MTGVECLLCSCDYRINWDAADNYFNLNFWKKSSIKLNTTVLFTGTLLNAAAHYLSNGHSSYTYVIHSLSKLIITRKLCNDDNFIDAAWRNIWSLNDLNSGSLLCSRSTVIFFNTKVCICILLHGHSIVDIHD